MSWKYVGFCVYSLQQHFLLVVARLLKEREVQDCSLPGNSPHVGCTQEDAIYGNIYEHLGKC